MVNITRQKLITTIHLDFGVRAFFTSPEYQQLAIVTFFKLIGIKEEDAESRLVEQVKKTCRDFVDQLRKKWKSPKIKYHLDRLEEQQKDWLNRRFEIPYLDEVSKPKAEEKPRDEEESTDEAPGPSFQVTTNEAQPPPAKKQKLSFLERVRVNFCCFQTVASSVATLVRKLFHFKFR